MIGALKQLRIAFGLFFLTALLASVAHGRMSGAGPVSEFLEDTFDDPILRQTRIMDLGFCSEWNPDFIFNKRRCCAVFVPGRRSRNLNKCPPQRYKTSYCDERTPEQVEYMKKGEAGKLPDVLELIQLSLTRQGLQAYCTVNNGFLVNGRALIPSPINRIELRSPSRCINFGTDSLTGMLEWLGREVGKQYSAPEYSKLHLLVGDSTAPRGGCLWGRHGRRGHASHTTGQDVDVGFLTPIRNHDSPHQFHRQFDAQSNAWLLRKIFSNPFGCVKVIFLDRRLIAKLDKTFRGDDEWSKIRRFVRHAPFHRNHFHIRVGHGPGQPGCEPNARPELEEEEFAPDMDNEGAGDAP